MVKRRVEVTSENGLGWMARKMDADAAEGVTVIPGDGISLVDGVLSLAVSGVAAGTYAMPIITVDDFGRVTAIETQPQGGSDSVVIDGPEELETVEAEKRVAVVIADAEGRSSMYLRGDDGEWRGPAFLTGTPGREGPRGADGLDGAPGRDGANGADGKDGADGEPGPKGDDGAQGTRGLQGISGAQGAPGVRGLQGPEGPMGSFLTPNAYGNLDEDRVAFIQTQPQPYFFLVNPAGDLRTNMLTPSGIGGNMALHLIGYNNNLWTDYGQLTGAQGPRGIQGADGKQGLQGIQGVKGDDGVNGTQGIPGERGLQGLAGAKGDAGPAGPAPAGGSTGQVLTKTGAAEGAFAWQSLPSFRGVMYTVAATGARVVSSTAFQPVDVPRLVYNMGGLSFRPSGTADNSLVVPAGITLIRIGFGLGFTGGFTVGQSYHMSVQKNGNSIYPGSPSLCGNYPYTTPRLSTTSTVLQVSPGDVFSFLHATSSTGDKTPSNHTFFSMEIVG